MEILSIVHPIHGIIGDVVTVLLCAVLIIPAGFVFFWAVVGAYRATFCSPDEDPPVMPEKSILQSLPLGAPRDGGNYIHNGSEYVPLHQTQAEELREWMKGREKEKQLAKMIDDDGWEWRGEEHRPHHSGMEMQITNDGPDDVEEEDEVERPDERMVLVSE